MSAEIEHHKMSGTTTSGASTTGPKVSIFAGKSGFVIPKNKVLGSLVPVVKGAKKTGGNDATNEESTNQVLRKTKWGPDPTQDAAVKKGRALAYQTRVDQITQQLKSRIREYGETQASQLADQHADPKFPASQIESKELEPLKLEWREIIGEIIKLNPSYQAPPDYEPLLKEATVSIPVKEHPGCNFVSLIFGLGGETKMRLEKETGAKIQVHGTRADTGEKVEISPFGGNDIQVAYEELNVHVSADTFEKVDGAVAMIELLVTSVSGNFIGGSITNVINRNQEVTTPFIALTGDEAAGQSAVGLAQSFQQGQFQYQSLQFPAFLAQAPGRPPPSFIPLQNLSAQIQSGTPPIHSSPLNPTIMPSLFGSQLIAASGPSRPQLPMQGPSHPYPPRNFPMPTSQPLSAQANILASTPFTGNQLQSTLLSPVAGPLSSSLPQPMSSIPPGLQSERPLTPVAPSVPGSLGNTGQMAPPMVSFQSPRPLVPQPGFLSSAHPSNVLAANTVSSASFPSVPATINAPMNHLTGASNFGSVSPAQMGSSSLPAPIQSSPVGIVSAVPSHASVNPVPGSMPMLSPAASMSQPTPQPGIIGSFPGHPANPTLARPPITAPKLLHSGPSDFTFQFPNSTTSVRGPNNQAVVQDTRFPRPPMPLSPRAPSFGLGVPNSVPPSGMHPFPSTQISNQMGQAQGHRPPNPFAGNSTPSLIPPRALAFPNGSPMPPTWNLSSAPQLPNLAGPFPPRPANPLQVRQNYPARTLRGNFMASNQHPSKNIHFASGAGGQQIYDPFSPT